MTTPGSADQLMLVRDALAARAGTDGIRALLQGLSTRQLLELRDASTAVLARRDPASAQGRRPKVLDLCCCAGGAAVGYDRAGFEVTGVDIAPRPRYPYRFVLGDALDAMREMCQDHHLVHLSPPCQKHTTLSLGTNRNRGYDYPDLIGELIALCEWFGVDWIMENVPAAPLRRDVMLCGEMFGLGVIRHRIFQIGGYGWDGPIAQPEHRPHRGPVRGWRHKVWSDGPYVAAYGAGGGKASVSEMQQAMDITWTDDRTELTEAIPPAYTEYLGQQWLKVSGWGAARRGEPDTWPVPECIRPYWPTPTPTPTPVLEARSGPLSPTPPTRPSPAPRPD